VERQPEREAQSAPPAASRRPRSAAAPAYFAGGALAAFAGSLFVARAPEAPEATLAATLASEVVFACAALGGAHLLGRDPRRLMRIARPELRAGEIAVLVVGFVCVSHALALALAWLELRQTGTLGEIDRVVADTAGPSRLLAFVALGVAPAFGEELLFRGFVQQLARPRLGVAAAIALSAAAFGAIHADPVQSPAAFVLGLYLGIVVEIGGALPIAILCHLVNNTLAVMGASAGGQLEERTLWALAAGLLFAGLAALTTVARRVTARRSAFNPPGAST
jgi:membrane protease YdiL (CAAX protease family)